MARCGGAIPRCFPTATPWPAACACWSALTLRGRTMCGIVGVVGTSAVNQRIYDALTVLQHRGQDAAGIATYGDGELYVRKESGLVRDVFQQRHMLELKGNAGIGHVRYPTAGCASASEA